MAALWHPNGKHCNMRQKEDAHLHRKGIPMAYITYTNSVCSKTGSYTTTTSSSTPEMKVDKPLCYLQREQVIIVGILTSVCQSEGQLCLRGRSMLICSAGKDYHSPLKWELAPLCSHSYHVFTLALSARLCACVCECVWSRSESTRPSHRDTESSRQTETNGLRL